MDINNLKRYADRVRNEDKVLDQKIIIRVAGVTFEGRQNFVHALSQRTPLRLDRDRRNEYDPYAVRIMAKVGRQWYHVGYIPRRMSKLVGQSLDLGVLLNASVHRIVGGHRSNGEQLSRGLEIIIKPER
jgi:hypothetical protein